MKKRKLKYFKNVFKFDRSKNRLFTYFTIIGLCMAFDKYITNETQIEK